MHIFIKTVQKTTQTNMQFQFIVSAAAAVVVVMHDDDSQSQEYSTVVRSYVRVLVDELSFAVCVCVLLLFARLI